VLDLAERDAPHVALVRPRDDPRAICVRTDEGIGAQATGEADGERRGHARVDRESVVAGRAPHGDFAGVAEQLLGHDRGGLRINDLNVLAAVIQTDSQSA